MLKLINVPTMFDIGMKHSNPEIETLQLSMIDSLTYRMIQKRFLSKEKNREAAMIDITKKELNNYFTNLEVTKTTIEFDKKRPLIIGDVSPDGIKHTLHIDGSNVTDIFSLVKLRVLKIEVSSH